MIALLFISKYKQILKMPNVQPVHFQDVNPYKWTGYLISVQCARLPKRWNSRIFKCDSPLDFSFKAFY